MPLRGRTSKRRHLRSIAFHYRDSHHRARLTPRRQDAGRKLQPHRVSQPDECPHQAGFQRCGSGRRNNGGRIVSGSDRPSRATLSTPARAAAKVAVSPKVEIPGLPRPPQTERNEPARTPPKYLLPLIPLSGPYPAPQPDRCGLRPSANPLETDSPCLANPGFAVCPKIARPRASTGLAPLRPPSCAARDHAHRRILSGSAGVPGGPAGSGFAR